MNELEFIKYVKQKRIEKNILIKDMAKLLEISVSYYSKLENNKSKLDYNKVKLLSEILEIDLNIIKTKKAKKNIVYYD